MSSVRECIFCRIAAGAVPANIVYEDAEVVAFLDNSPVTPGHTLMVPRQHFASMVDTPDAVSAHLFSRAKKIMGALKTSMSADYVAVSVVGIDVPHFHVHLIPRNLNDGFANFWPQSSYAEGEAERVSKKIKEAL